MIGINHTRWTIAASIALAAATMTACSKPSDKTPGTDTAMGQKGTPPADKRPAPADTNDPKLARATFAAGCFWCVEEVFESVKGVREAVSGYAGGPEKNPTYEQVGSGATGHAESVTVYYDSTVVNYPTLVRVFFASQDPTQVNGQGPDHGTQYRSIAFYRNDAEKGVITSIIDSLNHSGAYKAPIAAQVVPFSTFWPAEDYHQNYIQNNPNHPYVQQESIPRIIRFQKQFPSILKPERSRI